VFVAEKHASLVFKSLNYDGKNLKAPTSIDCLDLSSLLLFLWCQFHTTFYSTMLTLITNKLERLSTFFLGLWTRVRVHLYERHCMALHLGNSITLKCQTSMRILVRYKQASLFGMKKISFETFKTLCGLILYIFCIKLRIVQIS
jgi:hypothetical protein